MEANLKASLRDSIGSAESRRLRNDGSLPAVIYGMGMDPVSVVLDAREFNNALRSEAGANTILNLEVGKKKYTALAREIQKHPYKNEFLHVDLIQIDLTKTVEADVQINFIGTPIGVKEEGGLVPVSYTHLTLPTICSV